MTKILRIVTAIGFLWWLGAATMAGVPTIQADDTGGAAIGVTLAWIGILLFWLLLDKVLRTLGDVFSRKHA